MLDDGRARAHSAIEWKIYVAISLKMYKISFQQNKIYLFLLCVAVGPKVVFASHSTTLNVYYGAGSIIGSHHPMAQHYEIVHNVQYTIKVSNSIVQTKWSFLYEDCSVRSYSLRFRTV